MNHADCSECGNVSWKADDATRERLYLSKAYSLRTSSSCTVLGCGCGTRERLYDEDDARRHAEDAYTEQTCSHPRSRKGDRYCLDCGGRAPVLYPGGAR